MIYGFAELNLSCLLFLQLLMDSWERSCRNWAEVTVRRFKGASGFGKGSGDSRTWHTGTQDTGLLRDYGTLLGSQQLCPHLAPTPGWANPTPQLPSGWENIS